MALNLKRIFPIASAIVIILIFFLVFIGYLDVKKTLVTRISGKVTSLIGQRVDIGDLSFSPSAGINLYNMSIENPEDIGPGHLLHIKMIYLNMKFSELLRGKIYFKNIVIYSPELTFLKDKNGKLNISQKLMQFLTEKSEAQYQVDECTIDSGAVHFNKDERYSTDNINLHILNLSSFPDTRTLIQGHVSYAGQNKMKIDGWAYLNDELKKFSLSLSSEEFSLSVFKKYFDRYKINTEKTKLTIHITAEGDSEKGINLKSNIQIKDAGFIFFNKDAQNILLNVDAFLNTRDNSLVINNISLAAGDVLAIHSKGVITDILKIPFYRAELKINRIDLSAFNFMKDLKTSGIVTSNNIHVRGTFKKVIPEISGTLQFKDAAVKSNDMHIKRINANVTLSSEDRELSVKTEATARILMAGGYILNKPSDISLSVNTKGKSEKIDVISSVTLSPFEMVVKGNKTAYSDSINVHIEGSIKDTAFLGRSFFELRGIKYDDYKIPRLNGSFGVDFTKNTIAIKDLSLKTEDFTSSAGQIKIKMPEGKAGYSIDSKDVNISYPEKQIELNNFDLYADVHTGREKISGTIDFSIRKGKVQGITSGLISGTGNFDEKDFSVDIPRAEISGGKMKLVLKGRTSEDPFPLTMKAVAENIDTSDISKALSKLSGISYSIAGKIKSAGFDGTLHSVDSLKGNAFVTARNLSVLNEGTKRNILKEGFLDSEMTFKGNALEFKADAGTGNVSTGISGIIERFMKKDRSIKIKAHLPEVKAADIRNSFWDIFPDGLLYAGLDGSISSDVFIDYGNSRLRVNGDLMLKDFTLKGENNEYSIGPINGVVPIIYNEADDQQKPSQTTPFERSEFDNLHKYYSQKTVEGKFTKVTIGSLSYGFRFLEDITIWTRQNSNVLNIEYFSGNISEGRFYGSALVDISHGFNYRAGILLKGLSLTRLCENIEPLKGYISGKVEGIAYLKGSGFDSSQLIGKADFWTYSTDNEKTKISREFLQKIGGPSLKAYIGDRRFDKGIMSLYLQDGFVIFKELELSNKNIFGITDLSVKVVPFNNRIAIDHLMWSITEAAQRTEGKQE
jgi:hypothetical protein